MQVDELVTNPPANPTLSKYFDTRHRSKGLNSASHGRPAETIGVLIVTTTFLLRISLTPSSYGKVFTVDETTVSSAANLKTKKKQSESTSHQCT